MKPALKLCKIPNWYAKDCEKLFFADYVFKNDCELFQHSAPSPKLSRKLPPTKVGRFLKPIFDLNPTFKVNNNIKVEIFSRLGCFCSEGFRKTLKLKGDCCKLAFFTANSLQSV